MPDKPGYGRDNTGEIAGSLLLVDLIIRVRPGMVMVEDTVPAVGMVVWFPHVLSPVSMRGLVHGLTFVGHTLCILGCILLSCISGIVLPMARLGAY